MENISNLESFAKILTEKGYDGYFQTQAAYPDKIKDSIERYLECCKNGTDSPPQRDHMLLTTYLIWNNEDDPHVICDMYVKHLNDKFFLDKMEITLRAPGNMCIKKAELNNLTVVTAPTRKEAVAMVWDILEFKSSKSFKRNRF